MEDLRKKANESGGKTFGICGYGGGRLKDTAQNRSKRIYWSCLRPPLVYSPGVKVNFLSLFKIIDRGIPLPLTSINNRRSFIYLGNLVDAIKVCINHPNAAGQTYLVSDGEDVYTPELVRRVAAA